MNLRKDAEARIRRGGGTGTDIGPDGEIGAEIVIRIARTIEEVETIRKIWSAWKSHRDSNIDFCLNCVWSREEFVRPHIILIYHSGHPDAMLVGRLEWSRIDSKIGYVQIPGVRVRALVFAYGGLLGNPSAENSGVFVNSIMNSLRKGEAEVASLHGPNIDSPIYQNALTMPGLACRDHLSKPTAHYIMDLPGDVEHLYLGLSSGHRNDLKRKAKKLLEDFPGQVKVQLFCRPEELDSAISEVEKIASKTYQRNLGVGFDNTPPVRRMLHFFAKQGWLRLYILYLGSNPCAFSIGSLSDGVYKNDFLGHDPRFHKYSPGTYLLTRTLEDFCEEDISRVDFGVGEGRYKKRFGSERLMEASVHIFAPTLKGFLLNLQRTSTGLINNVSRTILQRTNLLPKIKKHWRSSLVRPTQANGSLPRNRIQHERLNSWSLKD